MRECDVIVPPPPTPIGPTAHQRGEQHFNATLTETDVVEIRAYRKAGWSRPAIAEKWGISAVHVYRICARRAWAHVK